MKKLLLIVTAMVLTFTLAGCNGGSDTDNPVGTDPVIAGIVEGGTIEVKVGGQLDLSSITAKDSDGNDLEVKITGAYNLNVVGDYDAVVSAKDAAGNKTSINVKVSVVAETCEENPDQEICKTDVEKAQEKYADLGIYNVDMDNNGTPDWEEVDLDLTMGFSYYGIDDDNNAVWKNVLKFMEQYPNIHVTRDPLFAGGWEGGDDGLLILQEAAAAEGTLPDIFFNPKGAETYDKGMTLDLTPYIETDQEATFITPNALSGMRTYDNLEIWGIPWQGVGPITAVNTTLLDQLGIEKPSYDWTYDEYEALRDQVKVINANGQCVFPGVIDFSYFGANYFDSVPNGYRGYNTVTQRFDFADATNYGAWMEKVALEAKNGYHFYDMTVIAPEQLALKCPDITDSWTDGREAIHTIYLWEFNAAIDRMVNKGFDVDIYPYPIAPEGGTTATYTYHDYYSINRALEADRVKAEAAFELVKWLTYGLDGLTSRWSLIDELNVLDENGVSPFVNGTYYLMDYIQGWPITSNPEVLAMHPLVKGFSEDSGGLDRYNFAAFKNEAFQYQMSNANPYPRQIPAFASVANWFEPWTIKDQMRDESLSWVDIAPNIQAQLNDDIEEYLRNYLGVNND
jgi:multiple sugar transport system substrate-binding protein